MTFLCPPTSPPIDRPFHFPTENDEPPPPYTPEPAPPASVYSPASGSIFTITYHPPTEVRQHQGSSFSPQVHTQSTIRAQQPSRGRQPAGYGTQTISNRPLVPGPSTHSHPARPHPQSTQAQDGGGPSQPIHTVSSGVIEQYNSRDNARMHPQASGPPRLPPRSQPSQHPHPVRQSSSSQLPPSRTSIQTSHGALGSSNSSSLGGALPPPPSTTINRNTQRQAIQQDVTPTDRPIFGRPFLNKGKVLIYPRGFWCVKCLNTGYKNSDPTHPCRGCWSKHSHLYSSAVQHSWPRPEIGAGGIRGTTMVAEGLQRGLGMGMGPGQQRQHQYQQAQQHPIQHHQSYQLPQSTYTRTTAHHPPLPFPVRIVPNIPTNRTSSSRPTTHTHLPRAPIMDDQFLMSMPGGWRSPKVV